MKDRVVYLEKLRVLAMLLVVYGHCCGAAFSQYKESAFQSYPALILFTLRNMCFSAVPVFFMISGVLFLNPKYELGIGKWLKKYVLKYFMVTVVFGWAYALMDMVYSGQSHRFSPDMLWKSFLNMLQGDSANHMWYMYELVGVMLFLPVIKAIVNNCEKRIQYCLGIIFFVFLFCIPALNSAFDIQIGFTFPLCSVYVMYMLIGHWLSEGVPLKRPLVLTIAVVIILGSLCTSIYDAYRYTFQDLNTIWNGSSSLVCFFRAIALFLLFQICFDKKNKLYSLCKFLSPYSFGIYLIHVFWVQVLVKIVHINPFEGVFVLRILLMWLAALVLSVLSCMIMKRIPLLKKLM